MVTTPEEKARAEFAARLHELLADMGVPVRGRAGRLREIWMAASHETISVPGARKWLDGAAIPATSKIKTLAGALGACSEWLLAGDGPKRAVKSDEVKEGQLIYARAQIDRKLLAAIIRAVEVSSIKTGRQLTAQQKAAAIAGAYATAIEVGASAEVIDSNIIAAAIATARDLSPLRL